MGARPRAAPFGNSSSTGARLGSSGQSFTRCVILRVGTPSLGTPVGWLTRVRREPSQSQAP
eukprot:3032649-Lingulodinium_polyedra.AAC.1